MTEPPYLRDVRTAYDAVAPTYAEQLRDELDGKPVDRAMLAIFAEVVRATGGGRVADLGCGPGRVTAHLAGLGLEPFGVDLSPGMVAVARRDHPGLSFLLGRLTDLALADAAVNGVVAWYSIIHTPPDQLGEVFAEFARVLAPGGPLLLAFQIGDERVHITRAYEHDLSLSAWRLPIEGVRALVTDAGLLVHTEVLRAPTGGETTPQAYLLATRP